MKANHILNTASNLLGVALLIVTFVHVTEHAQHSYSDELGFAAAILLLISCIASQRAMGSSNQKLEAAADASLLLAQFVLLCAVVCFWF
jgi:Zn-dependent protease with chaperone function